MPDRMNFQQILFAALVGCCSIASTLGDDHTQLLLLERDFFAWRLDDRPQFASSIGQFRNSDRLEHFDLDLMEVRMEKAQTYLDIIESINKTKLSKPDQIDYTILKDMLQTYIKGYTWRQWNYMNPLNWLEGNQRDPYFFVESTPFDNRGDFENYIARLNEMPKLFDEYMTFFDEAIRLGRTSNIVSMNLVPSQIDYILEDPAEKSVYFSPFLNLDRFNESIPTKERRHILKRGLRAVKRVAEAYKKLKNYLENEYMPHTRPGWGVGSLEGGKEFYQACLNWYLSLDMTPEELHELGVKEVNRVAGEMHKIMERQGYSGFNIRDYFAEINKNDSMFLHTEEEIVKEYEDIIFLRIEPTLSKLFRDQPGLPIRVEPMPWDGSRGQFISGSPDGIRPAIFYPNTFRKVARYTMTSLAMHESNPGHHLQVSYAATADLPEFRKNNEHSEKFRVPFAFPSYTAYMEGWALYAESLGVENHLYKTDYELMGYYDSEILRACRLVVDSGIHYFNWTREEAIDYFRNHTSEPIEGAKVEVDRYITWPGQAVAYKVGELKIRQLRDYAEAALGEYFDVRDFHMVVLGNGAVPLHILDSLVTEWVENHHKDAQDETEECECKPPVPGAKVRCQRSSRTYRKEQVNSKSLNGNGSQGSFTLSNKLTVAMAVLCVVIQYINGVR